MNEGSTQNRENIIGRFFLKFSAFSAPSFMIFSLFSSFFCEYAWKALESNYKKELTTGQRLNGFSSRYECQQHAKIVCFFVTQNSFILVVLLVLSSKDQSCVGVALGVGVPVLEHRCTV